ncbi:hypothetical protein ACFVIM_12820, partial [Streptomyces sp. NPDC057638]
ATNQFARPDFGAPQPPAPTAVPAQDPGATGALPRAELQGPSTGPFPRPELPAPGHSGDGGRPAMGQGPVGGQSPQPGSFPGPGTQDPAATNQFARPDFGAPQPPAPTAVPAQDPGATGALPRAELQGPAAPQPGPAPMPHGHPGQVPGAPGGDTDALGRRPHALPSQPQPEALPPAQGPGDGRTPLYDTLETDWFRSQQRNGAAPAAPDMTPAAPAHLAAPAAPASAAPTAPDAPDLAPEARGEDGSDATMERPPMPRRVPGGPPGEPVPPTGQSQPEEGWRTSPNDELVRQAERLRKPASGGVTTSGLPRRVPRANLVAGTAQEQNAQGGPQVSRAPDDVRGRLTNLRRGIQQGRQQNGSTTGSFDLGPTHQQER